MYFSTLTNEELKYFHHGLNGELSITLTEILASSNGVFKIETIKSNKLYRIYPLFYCKQITSSNTEDKIINTQCIIANKNSTETYYSFYGDNNQEPIYSTDEEMDTAWNHELLTKSIGGNLTTDEFNTMVYIMRRHNHLGGILDFEETNIINGIYGSYTITDTDRLRNDTGYIINDDLKENPLTLKLTNPFFVVADYRVTFEVVSITGANIYEDGDTDYIVHDTFTVSLVEDTDVIIDVTGYSNDSVLKFKSDLNILFNIPEIVNNNFTLGLVTNKNSFYPGETITATATLAGEVSVTGYNVVFTLDNGSTSVVATNSSGVASTTFTTNNPGSHIVKASVLGITSQKNITVTKKSTSITLVPSKISVGVDESFNYTVTLMNTFNNTALTNTSFRLYEGETYTTLTTGDDGTYTGSLTYNNPGTVNLQAKYLGDTTFDASDSTIRTINVNRYETDLTFTVTDTTTYIGDNDAYSLTLIDNSDNPISDATVKIYQNNTLYDTVTTDSSGEATGNLNHTHSGLYTYYAVYEGSNEYEGDTSTSTTVTVNKLPTSITYSSSSYSADLNENVTITGTLKDSHNNTPISNADIIFNDNGTTYNLTTNNNGVFTKTVKYSTAGTKTITATYNETETYAQTSKSTTVSIAKTNTWVYIGRAGYPYVNKTQRYLIALRETGSSSNISGQTVRMQKDNESIGTVKTASSEVTFDYTFTKEGTYTVTAYYAGSNKYNASQSTQTITITKSPTSIQLSGHDSAYHTGTITTTITLKDGAGVNVPNQSLAFTATGSDGSVVRISKVTDSNGQCTLTFGNFDTARTITLSCSYSGDNKAYTGSTASKTLTFT